MPAGAQARALLDLWEHGEREHPVDRALTVLAALASELPSDLADEPLSWRDARLLSCRTRLFGDRFRGRAACPYCGCGVEVELAASELSSYANCGPAEGSVDVDGCTIGFRLPTSRDLGAIVHCDGIGQARRRLAERCIGAEILDDDALAVIEEAMAAQAGLSDTQVGLKCPGCSREWSLVFDIGAFFWEELQAYARRLLRDIDVLARRYGWSESDVLALSETRRRHYVELAS
jgi:hypothetical protein